MWPTGLRLGTVEGTGSSVPGHTVDNAANLTPHDAATRAWEKVNHTNMCREHTAVKINAWATRRRPEPESYTRPIRAKSI